MHTEDIQKYCVLMEELKQRVRVIDFLLAEQGHVLFPFTTIETIGLQFRKVLELIAFGSLVANKSAYTKAYDNFSKAWNAELLLKDIERINPHFYPQPVSENRNTQTGVTAHIEPLKESFLSKEEFVKVYKKCGALVHASNPSGSKLDYQYYKACFPTWRERIITLMKSHTIHLVGSSKFYLVHIQERDGKTHHYTLEPKL